MGFFDDPIASISGSLTHLADASGINHALQVTSDAATHLAAASGATAVVTSLQNMAQATVGEVTPFADFLQGNLSLGAAIDQSTMAQATLFTAGFGVTDQNKVRGVRNTVVAVGAIVGGAALLGGGTAAAAGTTSAVGAGTVAAGTGITLAGVEGFIGAAATIDAMSKGKGAASAPARPVSANNPAGAGIQPSEMMLIGGGVAALVLLTVILKR